MKKNGDKFRLMSFGLGGNQGFIRHPDGSSCTLSGYTRPEHLQKEIDSGHYPPAEMEGCLLLDKRELLRKDPMLALKSPLCDAKLEPAQEDRFDTRSIEHSFFAQQVIKEFARTGGALAVASIPLGGFDTVSPEKSFQWWVERGAIGGVVKNGRVIWEGSNNGKE